MIIRTYNSKGYAFLLAILPVIMMYKVPGLNIGIATLLVLVTTAFALMVIILNSKNGNIKILLPLIIYYTYIITKSDVTNSVLDIAILIHLIAIACGAVSVSELRKYIETIAMISAICVIAQYLIHLLFGTHIPLIAYSLCTSEMEPYKTLISTGYGMESSLYRPSAFFLEPSHLSQYCSIGLISSLLVDKEDYKKAAIISLGMIFTTSGMGILIVAAVWCIYPFVSTKGLNTVKLRRIAIIAFVGIVSIFILMQIPFFQNALARITNTNSTSQYNALWGRTLYWDMYIKPLSGANLFFGNGLVNLPDVYFTGFMKTIYCYGIIGCILLYFSILVLVRKSKYFGGKLMFILYALLLFVANLTGFISVLYYFAASLCIGNAINKEENIEGDSNVW